jgi:hypothetical protein
MVVSAFRVKNGGSVLRGCTLPGSPSRYSPCIVEISLLTRAALAPVTRAEVYQYQVSIRHFFLVISSLSVHGYVIGTSDFDKIS